jgi:hypothetical protein
LRIGYRHIPTICYGNQRKATDIQNVFGGEQVPQQQLLVFLGSLSNLVYMALIDDWIVSNAIEHKKRYTLGATHAPHPE